MPRQPFLPKYLKSDLFYGPGHIPTKPKIAEAVGRCIMTWSYVDWQMAMLLAALMKANSEASVAIFLTLKNARAQREVLVAAADMTLTGTDRQIFDAIMLLYASLQSQRADIAHGIFGYIPDSGDDVVPWIETKNLSRDWIDKFHRPKQPDLSDEPDSKLAQKRFSSIYKLADFGRLEYEIRDLWSTAFYFTSHVKNPGSPLNEKLLETQCASPQMAQALSQMRNQKNNPSPAQ